MSVYDTILLGPLLQLFTNLNMDEISIVVDNGCKYSLLELAQDNLDEYLDCEVSSIRINFPGEAVIILK